jgi:proline-specific peptidase
MAKNQIFIGATLFLLTTLLLCCGQKNNLKQGEGFINVKGGKVWYRIVGEGKKTPIIMFHGGPGIPSYYLKPLAELSKDRPVIFFDQLGCGKSDKITDTTLMTIDNYVAELGEVINHLGLKEFYLYGQSWGTMLGTEYYLKKPNGIKALILSSPSLSVSLWKKDADFLIATLPDSVQKAIRTNEQNKTYDTPSYQQAVGMYYSKFLTRKQPWSADMDSCLAQRGGNVYMYMGGPSEFTMTGELKNYDVTKRLNEIKVPTLFMCGEFDEARPETVKYYQSLVAGSKFAMTPNAAHLTMQDNAQADIKSITDFLNKIE